MKRVTGPLAAGILIGTVALLLNRLIGLVDLFANRGGPAVLILRMLGNLVPQYLSTAIPAAFFIAILFAILRMSNDSELDVIRASGVSLRRLAVPMMAMAVVLTVALSLILGFLQPYTRYAYRSLAYLVTETSWNAAIERGMFFSGFGGKTILIGDIADGGHALSKIFIQETDSKGKNVVLTAQSGELAIDPRTFALTLILRDGVRVETNTDGSNSLVSTFNQSRYPLKVAAPEPFRPRGNRHSELSLRELIHAYLRPQPKHMHDEISSELNYRIAQALSILFLPLIAVPLGLQSRRRPKRIRLLGGIAILIIYNQALQLGQNVVEGGHASAFIVIWVPFLILALGSLHLFYVADSMLDQDPLAVVFDPLERFWKWITTRPLASLRRNHAAHVPGAGAQTNEQ
ncbi:MAG: LptF/LptG family permease [Dongiaceae bacterium]